MTNTGEGLLVVVRGTSRLTAWTTSMRAYTLDPESFREVREHDATRLLALVDRAYDTIASAKGDDDVLRDIGLSAMEKVIAAFVDAFGDAAACFEWHRAFTRLSEITLRPADHADTARAVRRCARSDDFAAVAGRRPTRRHERDASLAVCEHVLAKGFTWVYAPGHRERISMLGEDIARIMDRLPWRRGQSRWWREHVEHRRAQEAARKK